MNRLYAEYIKLKHQLHQWIEEQQRKNKVGPGPVTGRKRKQRRRQSVYDRIKRLISAGDEEEVSFSLN